MRCDVCGSDNLEGAAYCEDCGAKLVVAHAVVGAASSPSAQVIQPPPPVDPGLRPPPQPVAQGPGASVLCPSCGADNPGSEDYCVDCGANLGRGAAEHVVAQNVGGGAAAVAPVVPVGHARLTLDDREFLLDREITTMGRRSPADQIEPDIDLTDDDSDSYVSRRHAQIVQTGDHYVLEDVGSSNGSFINNTRLLPGVQQVLNDGDHLRLGKTEFVFHER